MAVEDDFDIDDPEQLDNALNEEIYGRETVYADNALKAAEMACARGADASLFDGLTPRYLVLSEDPGVDDYRLRHDLMKVVDVHVEPVLSFVPTFVTE